MVPDVKGPRLEEREGGAQGQGRRLGEWDWGWRSTWVNLLGFRLKVPKAVSTASPPAWLPPLRPPPLRPEKGKWEGAGLHSNNAMLTAAAAID